MALYSNTNKHLTLINAMKIYSDENPAQVMGVCANYLTNLQLPV